MTSNKTHTQDDAKTPKTIEDLREDFASIEAWHEDDPEWDEIRSLHQQLISMETRKKNVAENSVDRFLRALRNVGIRQDVVNQPTFIWLMEHVANKNLGKIPIFHCFPIKEGVIVWQISDDQIMGYLTWMNLLETRTPNYPVPILDMENIIAGRDMSYADLDRRKAMLDAGVIDEFANIKRGAVEQSCRDWVKFNNR